MIAAFANADTTTAEYLSKRCGETVLTQLDTNLSRGTTQSKSRKSLSQQIGAALSGDGIPTFGSAGTQAGSSDNFSMTPRRVPTPLITPDEVMVHFARETGSMMVLINGARPIRLRRIRYYDDPLFKDLADPSPFHKPAAHSGR